MFLIKKMIRTKKTIILIFLQDIKTVCFFDLKILENQYHGLLKNIHTTLIFSFPSNIWLSNVFVYLFSII